MERVISLLGLVVMMGLAWAMSEHKKQVSFRVVLGRAVVATCPRGIHFENVNRCGHISKHRRFFHRHIGLCRCGHKPGIWRRIPPPFLCLQSTAHHHLLFLIDVHPLLPRHHPKSR